jgi:hypothetical protein
MKVRISSDFYTWFLQCSQKDIEGCLKICVSYMVDNQIWLNLPKDDSHFNFPQKFLKNTLLHDVSDSQFFVCSKAWLFGAFGQTGRVLFCS